MRYILNSNLKFYLKRAILIFAVTIFIVGTFLSIKEISTTEYILNYKILLSIALVQVIIVYLSCVRLSYMAKLGNVTLDLNESLRILLYGSLLNLLPIPGALVARLKMLKDKMGWSRSIRVNLIVTLIWISACLAILSCASFYSGDYEIGKVTFFIFLISFLAVIIYYFITGLDFRNTLITCLVQTIVSSMNFYRLLLLFYFFSASVEPIVPAMISLLSIVIAGAGIAPGGIGLAESMSAFVTSYYGESTSIGFLVMAMGRVFTYITSALIGFILLRNK